MQTVSAKSIGLEKPNLCEEAESVANGGDVPSFLLQIDCFFHPAG